MLLPLAGDEWAELPSGTKINKSFPSGTYEFILGEEEGVGRYLMCSLFSPVFEFQNQEAAVVTAEAVLQSLMDETRRDDVSTREREISKIWSGEDASTAAVAVAGGEEANRPSLEERIQKPISRRDVLRGAFLPGGKE
jgi:[NiFe] hydrogenase assembly HybE family chaperone